VMANGIESLPALAEYVLKEVETNLPLDALPVIAELASRARFKAYKGVVLAPPIRPSLPPAIHTAEMERRAESGWARFDKNDQLNALERSMTPTLEQRAGDRAHLQLVREACRQSVAAFVRKWLMREGQWRSDRFTSIVVVFPDEAAVSSDEELSRLSVAPTLRLDRN